MRMEGKLIVLEGTDGSGKSTQFSLLCRRMEAEGPPFHRIVFPQYQEPSSALVRMYLGGEFGSSPSDVNPYAASTFYAVDRYAAWKKVWGRDYAAGKQILSDRYTTSNAVHQTGKLPESEWEDFLRWLFDFEYGKLGLPEPSLVLYLDMPTEQAVENLRRRERETHTTGSITGVYEYGCELFKKRMECAIMIKVAENQELAAKGIEVPIELGSTCNACADGEACE